MKKLILLSALFAIATSLFAQDSENLNEIRLFTDTAVLKAEQEARKLDIDSVVLGDILFEYSETALGRLMSDLLVAGITNDSNLSIMMNPSYNDGGNWLILEGVIHQVESVVYMQLKVLEGQSRTPLAVLEKTMNFSPLSSMLYVDSYDDDYYYDTPVVQEDYFMEPNDNSHSSVPYTLGDSFELALTRNDNDWFSFELEEDLFTDDAVMVEIYTTGDTDTYMRVYGPDDPNRLYNEVDDYYDSNAGMTITVEEPGIYWVEVSGYSDDTNGYYYLESTVEAVGFADEYEPNNTQENATPIDWDNEQTHSFAIGDGVDIFRLDLNQSAEVTIHTEGFLDTYFDLYDEYGDYISSDDDGGKDANARIEIDLDRGVYFLEVKLYDETGSGEYQIIANQE